MGISLAAPNSNSICKIKAELSDNDAVSDDLASQAYIEEFGSETFQRALNAMNANKASR